MPTTGAALKTNPARRGHRTLKALPEWTQSVLPQQRREYSQLPNVLRVAARKLEGLEYKIVTILAFSTFGGRFDERHGIDPVDGDRRRPEWVPISIEDLAFECGVHPDSVQATIDRLSKMGVVRRDKAGRKAWYALSLDAIPALEDKAPRELKKRAVSEIVEEPVAVEVAEEQEAPQVVRHEWREWRRTLAAGANAEPVEIPKVCEAVSYVNEGTVPVEISAAVNGEQMEIRFKAFVETKGDTRPTPDLQLGYSKFAKWLGETWKSQGFAAATGVGVKPEVAKQIYAALDGAPLEQFAALLARKRKKVQSPLFLVHLAKEAAEHKHVFAQAPQAEHPAAAPQRTERRSGKWWKIKQHIRHACEEAGNTVYANWFKASNEVDGAAGVITVETPDAIGVDAIREHHWGLVENALEALGLSGSLIEIRQAG